MKTLKSLTIILITLVSVSLASSGWVTLMGSSREPVEPSVLLSESSTSAVRLEVILPGFSVNEIEYDETTYDQVSIPGYGTTIDEGDPALPVISVLIALPDGATVSSTPSVSIHTETTLDDYYLYPVEGTTDHPDYTTGAMVNAFTINDGTGEVYATDAFYPADLQIELIDDGYLYEQRLAVVSYCPFQFNPQTEELRVISQATIEVSYSSTGVSWNTTGAGPLHEMLEDLCLNYNWDGNVSAPTAPNPTSSGSLYWFDDSWDDDDLEEQKVDYLVIVAKKFEDMISSDTSIDVIGQYLDELLRWRSTDVNSPDNFDIMIVRLDDLVPYMSGESPAEERVDSTNLRVGELLDQFIEKIYETTSADHINGGSLEYVLFVGDAHVDGNFDNTPRDAGGYWDYDYNITSFTMSSPDYDTDIPTVLYDVEITDTWEPGKGKYWYPWFTDVPYADVGEGDFYEETGDHTFYGRDLDQNQNETNFTADPELGWPELITARITADEELATDDNNSDNRTAVQVMSDICKKILDFEKNPPVEIIGEYRKEICIYDGTNDGLREARDDAFGTYLVSDDRYWSQHGYDVNYLVGWEFSGIEHGDETITDEITELFSPSTGRSGELIFVYQNHGGVRSWNPVLKNDPSSLGPVPVFVFTNDDVDLLDNGPFYPLVFSLCCTTGHFCEDRLEDIGDSVIGGSYNERTLGCDDNRNIAETLLRDADGGAMGVWAATSSTGRVGNIDDVNLLAEYMNQHGDVSFGELCTHLRFSGSSSLLSHSNFLKYITFGDPALHVTDQWREPYKPDLMVNWDDVRLNDDGDSDISDNHYPYLQSGSDAELTAYVQVQNIGLSSSGSTTATFRFYSTVGNLGQPTLLDTVSGVTVVALSAGDSIEISASYDDFIGDYGSDPDNGIWRDSIDRNIRFHFTCEIDPSDTIDESVEDNNTVAWPDDNVMSYNPNPDWEFDPEDEDDDVTQDPFVPLDELWFFPNMAGFPDKLELAKDATSSGDYVIVADLNQDGQQQGLVTLSGRPYLIDDSGIDETTSFVGLNDDVILSIAVGDIAGDADLEIVGLSSTKLSVWNGDGSLVTGWPEVLTGNDRFIPHLIVSDFDADSKAEIGVVVKVSSGIEVRAYVFNGDFEFETLNGATECVGISSGNIDGNPGNEYIVIEGNLSPSANNTVYKLYAWDSDFNSVLATDSYTIEFVGTEPLICDYDDDGTTEIMLTENLAGTPTGQAYNTSSADAESGTDAFKAVLDTYQSSPWVAAELVPSNIKPEFLTTMAHDGQLGEMYLSSAESGMIYDPNSEEYTASEVYSPILADLDDDDNVDIALACGNGYIYFRKADDGDAELDDLFTTDLRFYIPDELDADYSEYVKHLAIADLDDDGDYEIIAVSNLGHVFVWETDCDDASSIQWEQYLHDAGHRNYADEY